MERASWSAVYKLKLHVLEASGDREMQWLNEPSQKEKDQQRQLPHLIASTNSQIDKARQRQRQWMEQCYKETLALKRVR